MDEMDYEMHAPPGTENRTPIAQQVPYASLRCPYMAQSIPSFHTRSSSSGYSFDPVHPSPIQQHYHSPWMQLPVPNLHHHNPHLQNHHYRPGHHMAYVLRQQQEQQHAQMLRSMPQVPATSQWDLSPNYGQAQAPSFIPDSTEQPQSQPTDSSTSSSREDTEVTTPAPSAVLPSGQSDSASGYMPVTTPEAGHFTFRNRGPNQESIDAGFWVPRFPVATQSRGGRSAGAGQGGSANRNEQHSTGTQTPQSSGGASQSRQDSLSSLAPHTPAAATTRAAAPESGTSGTAVSSTAGNSTSTPGAVQPRATQSSPVGSAASARTSSPRTPLTTGGFERRRALRALNHRRSGSSSASGISSDDELDPEIAPPRPTSFFEGRYTPNMPAEERVRAQQLFRGSVVNRRVASKSAISSLESVNIDSLEESEKMCIICYNDFGTPTPEGINEAPLRLPKCKHIFGDHCIKKWFEESDSCPYCRDKVHSEPQLRASPQALQQFMRSNQYLARREPNLSSGQYVIQFRRFDTSGPSNGAPSETSTATTPAANNAGRSGMTGERRAPPESIDDNRRRTRRRHANGSRSSPASAFPPANTATASTTAQPSSFAGASTVQNTGLPPSQMVQPPSQPPALPQFQQYHEQTQLTYHRYPYAQMPTPFFIYNQSPPQLSQAGNPLAGAAASDAPSLGYPHLPMQAANRSRFGTMQPSPMPGYNAPQSSQAWLQYPANSTGFSAYPQVLPPPQAPAVPVESRPMFSAPFNHQFPPVSSPMSGSSGSSQQFDNGYMQGPATTSASSAAAPALHASTLPRIPALGGASTNINNSSPTQSDLAGTL